MNRPTAKDIIVAAAAASPTPMTARELIVATQLDPTTVHTLVYQLRNEGRLRRRTRPNPGRARALSEYFVQTPAPPGQPSSASYDDEVPDHIWWAEQKARGFSRPARALHAPQRAAKSA